MRSRAELDSNRWLPLQSKTGPRNYYFWKARRKRQCTTGMLRESNMSWGVPKPDRLTVAKKWGGKKKKTTSLAGIFVFVLDLSKTQSQVLAPLRLFFFLIHASSHPFSPQVGTMIKYRHTPPPRALQNPWANKTNVLTWCLCVFVEWRIFPPCRQHYPNTQ